MTKQMTIDVIGSLRVKGLNRGSQIDLLMLSMLGKNFKRQTVIFFLFYLRKYTLTFETICTECQHLFSGIYVKNTNLLSPEFAEKVKLKNNLW